METLAASVIYAIADISAQLDSSTTVRGDLSIRVSNYHDPVISLVDIVTETGDHHSLVTTAHITLDEGRVVTFQSVAIEIDSEVELTTTWGGIGENLSARENDLYSVIELIVGPDSSEERFSLEDWEIEEKLSRQRIFGEFTGNE